MINRLILGLKVLLKRCGVHAGGVCVAVAMLVCINASPSLASLPPTISQFIGVENTIVNEAGQPLAGTDPFSSEFGIPVVQGALVQILKATDGTIYPPEINGEPDSRNILLSTTRIGLGISPALARSGKFSSMLAPRPGGGTKIFVRVFNASSLEDASFYGDSEVFTVSSIENSSFMASVASTDKPLDGLDSDNDGLSNSREQALGTDPYAADTDGDNYSDADELVAGTDSMNEDSFPVLTRIYPEGNGLTRINWWPAVSGRTYRIYCSEDLMNGGVGTELASITLVTEGEGSVVLTNATLPKNGSFSFRVSK